jgi:hypothetical protein
MPQKPSAESQLIVERFVQLNVECVARALTAVAHRYDLPGSLPAEFAGRRIDAMVRTPFKELMHLYRECVLQQIAAKLQVPLPAARQLVASASVPAVRLEIAIPFVSGAVADITTQYMDSILAEVARRYALPLQELRRDFLAGEGEGEGGGAAGGAACLLLP